jgi:zinc transporter
MQAGRALPTASAPTASSPATAKRPAGRGAAISATTSAPARRSSARRCFRRRFAKRCWCRGHTCHLDLDDGWLYGDPARPQARLLATGARLEPFPFRAERRGAAPRLQAAAALDRPCAPAGRLVERGARPFRSPCELLEAIIGQSLDGLSGELVKIGEELDEIEDRIVRDHWHNERHQLNESRRRLMLLHREMASVTTLFRQLEHRHHLDLPLPISDMAERLSNRAVALVHDGEQLQGQARLLQDELMARLTAESNRLLYILSMLTAVLLAMTIISGLFGMNVGGIPFTEGAHGFWIVSLFAAAMAGIVLLVLRLAGRGRM